MDDPMAVSNSPMENLCCRWRLKDVINSLYSWWVGVWVSPMGPYGTLWGPMGIDWDL